MTTTNSNLTAATSWLMPAIPNAQALELVRISLIDPISNEITGQEFIIAVEWLEKRAVWNVMTVAANGGHSNLTMLASKIATNPDECDEFVRLFIGSSIQSCPAGYEMRAYVGQEECAAESFPLVRAFLGELQDAQDAKDRIEFAVGKIALN